MKSDELDGCEVSAHGDRIIPERHFGYCPFHEMIPSDFGQEWSLAVGGYPLEDGTATITFFHRDEHGKVLESLTRDRWVIPAGLAHLFKVHERWGDERRLARIKGALSMD